MNRTALSVLIVLSLALVAQGITYTKSRVYSGADLYSPTYWDYFTGDDPTHGAVEYLSYNDAKAEGLLSYTTLGTNYYSTRIGTSKGTSTGTRKSVRISSKATWNRGLFVMEFSHMPTGCSTWPAFWMLSKNAQWPAGGEIDVVEGVNNAEYNTVSLHTLQGCQMDGQSSNGRGAVFTGHWKGTKCASTPQSNQGCSQEAGNKNSYGAGFNAGGGGTYALEITDSFIRVFFFPGKSHRWQSNPNPDTWGTPQARFNLGSNCPSNFFYNLQLILDVTFCGDWAGGAFNSMCQGDCKTYVANNHRTLDANAYWAINSITAYTP